MSALPSILRPLPFFQRTDWLSFLVTTTMVLAVYLCTLNSEIGLGNDGHYAVAAMYGGVSNPPGFPAWVLYSWMFAKIFPFGNVAWRVAFGSAVAGALTGGIIALMVSRGGALVLEGMRGFQRLAVREEKWLRFLCGCVAGMSFCLDSAFWAQAVIPEIWALDELLFCLVLCLLMRWLGAPSHRGKSFYAAGFIYGVLLTDNQLLLAALVGLQIFVTLVKPALGRNLFLVNAVVFAFILLGDMFGLFHFLGSDAGMVRVLFISLGVGSVIFLAMLRLLTGRILTEWKTTLLLLGAFTFGLLVYFYVPIASMTTPPMNWG